MSTKEFDDFHDGVQEVTDIAWLLQEKARAYRVLRQRDLAEEFADAADTLKAAIGKIKVGFSAEINNRCADAQMHTSAMLATLVHFATKDQEASQ